MPTTSRTRAAILSSAIIATTVAFGPVGLQQASAATPSMTHVSTTAVNVPKSTQDYRRGFKDGFRAGLRQGQRTCNRGEERAATVLHKDASKDYRRGFKDGFKTGIRQGQRSC